MAEFRKWTVHFDDGNNVVDGKRVQDPPGFAAGGGKELVGACTTRPCSNSLCTASGRTSVVPGLQVTAGSTSKHLNMDVAVLKQKRQDVSLAVDFHVAYVLVSCGQLMH